MNVPINIQILALVSHCMNILSSVVWLAPVMKEVEVATAVIIISIIIS